MFTNDNLEIPIPKISMGNLTFDERQDALSKIAREMAEHRSMFVLNTIYPYWKNDMWVKYWWPSLYPEPKKPKLYFQKLKRWVKRLRGYRFVHEDELNEW